MVIETMTLMVTNLWRKYNRYCSLQQHSLSNRNTTTASTIENTTIDFSFSNSNLMTESKEGKFYTERYMVYYF